MADEDLPTDRRSPVGEPVIRGDETITGERAERAVRFDPTDPESVEAAAETVQAFAQDPGTADNIDMLRGAAACAALVRAEGSYKAASERAGEPVTVPFIRKWARVHDLPRAIRIHVARGDIAPTAAKHIARVGGEARYQLAWAAIDNDLTVRKVRKVASDVNNGETVEAALTDQGVTPGALRTQLSADTYRELRRRAALEAVEPDAVIESALHDFLD
jgi:hypothetical protein